LQVTHLRKNARKLFETRGRGGGGKVFSSIPPGGEPSSKGKGEKSFKIPPRKEGSVRPAGIESESAFVKCKRTRATAAEEKKLF